MEKKLVTGEDMKALADMLKRIGTYYVAGSHSVSVPSLNTKYLNADVVKLWPNLEDEPEWMAPGEAARVELNRAFPDIRKVGWRGPMVRLFDKRPPMHYSGPAMGEFTYIDLKSAWWQFYRPLWLDQPWPRGYRGRYPLLEVADQLANWKAARNAVVGIARSRYVFGQKGSRQIKMAYTNKFLSPGLWATIMDLAHWVASKALEYGAVYVNVDGYMFPGVQSRQEGYFKDFLEAHSLAYDVRAWGEGEIRSWNSYKISHYQTKPYRLGLIHKTEAFTNVQRSEWSDYRRNVIHLVRSERG